MGENGSWVSDNSNSNSGIQCGNYVNYLPQDEAVASGLGANEGGLDPVESQRVVDLLNRELSRLLELKPRDFWKEDLQIGILVLRQLILSVQKIMRNNKLLDLPNLLDICALYGHENEDLTRLLVVNAIKAQWWMHDKFTAVLSHFLSLVQTMYQRCSSSLEVLFATGNLQDQPVSQLRADYLAVMDFINDAVVNMDAFVAAYKHAAVFFCCPVDTRTT